MTAVVIPFPRINARRVCRPFLLTQDWLDRHLTLVNAALDLLSADDPAFARRCCALAAAESSPRLTDLVTQLKGLGDHLADVADALSLTAERIEAAMAPQGAS